MIIRVSFFLLVLSFSKASDGFDNEVDGRSHWPLPIYNEKLMHLRKRELIKNGPDDGKSNLNTHQLADLPNNETANANDVKQTNGQTEGGVVKANDLPLNNVQDNKQQASQLLPEQQTNNKTLPNSNDIKSNGNISTLETAKVNTTVKPTEVIPSKTVVNEKAASNSTESESLLKQPGVVKRGLIVFGGFALLAVAYFVFYRRKGKKYDANNLHNSSDTNQFRYGVLQSDDRRDNLELSRIPLTMESDEDDEEDLEIFDLEQKRKSLSYVNLQTNDEDLVLHSSKDESKNNLLLDIEDGPSDTLINWSNNGNKSIL